MPFTNVNGALVNASSSEVPKDPTTQEAVLPFFRWRVYGAREPGQASPLRSDRSGGALKNPRA